MPRLEDVAPIETPEVLQQRETAQRRGGGGERSTTRRGFRQGAATERIRWHTESFHKHFDGLTPVRQRRVLQAAHVYAGRRSSLLSGSGWGWA